MSFGRATAIGIGCGLIGGALTNLIGWDGIVLAIGLDIVIMAVFDR